MGALWTLLCMPEVKGRTLEEIDQLFEGKVPAWKFSSVQTHGLTHDVAMLATEKAESVDKVAAVGLQGGTANQIENVE